MKRNYICLLIALLTGLFNTWAAEPMAEIVTVRDGVISPTNVVAAADAVAQTVAQAAYAYAEAQAVGAAAEIVSNAVAGVTEIINALEGIGYIQGYVLRFGAGVEADTNMVATIVQLTPAGNDSTNSLWDVWTHYTEDPHVTPVVRYSESLGRTNLWGAAMTVGPAVLDEVQIGGIMYEAYRQRVAMPLNYTSAFFRVYADVMGLSTNSIYLPVNNGIAVNGEPPLTATFTSGTNVIKFVGGIRVQ